MEDKIEELIASVPGVKPKKTTVSEDGVVLIYSGNNMFEHGSAVFAAGLDAGLWVYDHNSETQEFTVAATIDYDNELVTVVTITGIVGNA